MLVPIDINEDDLMRISHWYSTCFKTREMESEDKDVITKIHALLISTREVGDIGPFQLRRPQTGGGVVTDDDA